MLQLLWLIQTQSRNVIHFQMALMRTILPWSNSKKHQRLHNSSDGGRCDCESGGIVVAVVVEEVQEEVVAAAVAAVAA